MTSRTDDDRIRILEEEVARQNEQIAEWSRQNLAIIALEVAARKYTAELERQLAEMRDALNEELQRSTFFERDREHIRSVLREERAGAERQLADASGHIAALTASLETRRLICNDALKRAEFAEDQLDVAIKDRDHAERQIAEAQGLSSQSVAQCAREQARADVAERRLAEKSAVLSSMLLALERFYDGADENGDGLLDAFNRARAAQAGG